MATCQQRPAAARLLYTVVLTILAATIQGTQAQQLLRAGTYITKQTVPAGVTWYLSGSYTFSAGLAINGKLVCGGSAADKTSTINLRATRIEVNGAGTFECGTRAAPYTGKVTITMIGSSAEGNNVIDVAGRILLHGKPRASWTSITSSIRPDLGQGDSFTTQDPVDWQPGEKIVVTSTDFHWESAEEAIIASVARSGAGSVVSVVPGSFQNIHYGELQTYTNKKGGKWVLDERAQVALLDRNIVIQGSDVYDSTGMGAIITIRGTGNGYAMNTKFTKVGQLGRLGTYPWHWHMLGNRQGNYFINNVVTLSKNRCVTIHGTDNVLVERNVCYDNVGHAYFIEDGCEEGNTLKYNLGLTTRRPTSIGAGPIDTDTTHLSTFWITNPKNFLIGNVAAGSQFAGYWFMLPTNATRECFGVKPGQGPRFNPLGAFDHNIAHSNDVGVGIEGGIKNSDRAPTTGPADYWDPPTYPVMTNNTIYKNKNGQRSLWVTMFSTIYFRNTKLADNGGSTLFSGQQIADNSIYVGESANIFGPRQGGNRIGFTYYDGPAGIMNSHFAGFSKYYGWPQTDAAGAIKAWNNYIYNVTFDTDATKKMFTHRQDINYSLPQVFNQGIIDRDGSITGRANSVLMWQVGDARSAVVPPSRQDPHFQVIKANCPLNKNIFVKPNTATLSENGVYVCTGMAWATVVIRQGLKNDGKPHILDISRSDGVFASITNGGLVQYQYNHIVSHPITYTIKYRNRDSLTWDGTVPRPFLIDMMFAEIGQQARIVLDGLPTGNWKYGVARCYISPSKVMVQPTPGPRFGWTMVAHAPVVTRNMPRTYPNQRQGVVRYKVCVSTTGQCQC